MNATIIHKANVKSNVLDKLAMEMPTIISDTLELPGGKMAVLKPQQISLEFSQASPRDVGSEIKIMVFARDLAPRQSKGNALANSILEKVIALVASSGEDYSIDLRLYLMEIGAAEYQQSSIAVDR